MFANVTLWVQEACEEASSVNREIAPNSFSPVASAGVMIVLNIVATSTNFHIRKHVLFLFQRDKQILNQNQNLFNFINHSKWIIF